MGRLTDFRLPLALAVALALAARSASADLPLVINTWNFRQANEQAWTELTANAGSPIAAIVAGCSACERLQCDGTVGFGGSPDERGETTLDALLMDGRTMNVGAVAALRHIREAVAVARHVLENTEHSLLAGEQATQFAEQLGFRRRSLVTPASAAVWNAWERANCQPNFWTNVRPDPRQSCGPYEPLNGLEATPAGNQSAASAHEFGERHHDTIGMLAIDRAHNVAAGTSTNGARHKIPGRVGDSPIPGSGAYADNNVGAAAATGDGDVLMRFLPSMLAVEFMRTNVSPSMAARLALERIRSHYPTFVGAIVAANRNGVYGAACHGIDRFPYVVSSGNRGPTVETVRCF